MTVYSLMDQVPLTFSRIRAGALVTGLTVTVVVKNARTGVTMLASTACPEVGTASGIYTYVWTPNVTTDTTCLVTFTVGGQNYSDYIALTNDAKGGVST